jgi:hypothetical protein
VKKVRNDKHSRCFKITWFLPWHTDLRLRERRGDPDGRGPGERRVCVWQVGPEIRICLGVEDSDYYYHFNRVSWRFGAGDGDKPDT